MGHKNRGPSGPTVREQFQSAESGYQSRARDFAAEGGGLVQTGVSAEEESRAAPGKNTQRNKQEALDAYKNRMESKFKTAAPGNLRETAAGAGAGVGSTNVSPGTRQKQIIGEEENRKGSLFVG